MSALCQKQTFCTAQLSLFDHLIGGGSGDMESRQMRSIIVAGIVALILGAVSYVSLNARQEPTGTAFTASGARLDTHWIWRSVSTEPGTLAKCEPRNAWQWIFVDFGHPAGESSLCSYSQ